MNRSLLAHRFTQSIVKELTLSYLCGNAIMSDIDKQHTNESDSPKVSKVEMPTTKDTGESINIFISGSNRYTVETKNIYFY